MVYLLHFVDPATRESRPYRHARHYLGYTAGTDLVERMRCHRNGRGARLVAVILAAGLDFTVARVWPDGGRRLERKLKRLHNAPRLCPICNPRAGAEAPRRRDPKRGRGVRRTIPPLPADLEAIVPH